ncbi:MAG: hypothetical protein ABMA00_14145 [Gemmatimonas sp.]
MSEAHIAVALGLSSPVALRHMLVARGLPPFYLFRDWYYLVRMLERAESGEPIAQWAMYRGDYATVYYRFAARLTGKPWRTIVARGSGWAKTCAMAVWAPHLATL